MALRAGLERACAEGVAEDWLLMEVQKDNVGILVFASAVITTITGQML